MKTVDPQDQQITDFAEKTTKEVKWWDWLGRILPLFSLGALAICHVFGFDDVRDSILSISVIVFFTVCIVWWFWALKKIVRSVNYIQQAHTKFTELASELKRIRKDIRQDDSRR